MLPIPATPRSFALVSSGVVNIRIIATIIELHNIQQKPTGHSGLGCLRLSLIQLTVPPMPQYLLIEKIDIYPFEINGNHPALLEARQRA